MGHPPIESDFARTERASANAGEHYHHAMMHAYLDDSGDDKKKHYAVCGGVLGDSDTMIFSEAFWIASTKHLAKPFRSTDCECQRGQFKNWKKADCDKLMAQLVDVLKIPAIQVGCTGTAVPIPIFQKLFPESHKEEPQRLAIRHALVNLVKLARRNNVRVKVWFESGPHNGDILRAYEDVASYKFPNAYERGRLAGLSLGDKTLAPLQAADLIARECFKAAMNRGQRQTRKPLKRMWDQSGMLEFDESCLVKLKEAGGPLDIKAVNGMGDNCHMKYIETTPYSQIIRPV